MESFVHSSRIEQPLEKVFAWHTREGAFERLTPPWEHFKVIERRGNIQNNGLVKIKAKIGPLSITWVVRHSEYVPEKQFKDLQIKGLFSSFVHSHLFEPFGTSCLLKDRIEYSLPAGPMGRMIARRIVDRKLRKIFDYRHRIIKEDLQTHLVIDRIRKSERPLTIALTGASGFVGSSLGPFLTTGRHRVVPLFKKQHISPSKSGRASTFNRYDNLDVLDNHKVDAVVNLAGESIFGRWTKEKRRKLSESRLNTTRTLCEKLASLVEPPDVLVSVSAIAYYGDRGDEVLSEDSLAGNRASSIPSRVPSVDYLSDLCRQWEQATHIAKEAGIRVVNLRLGIVLSSSGGLLAKILPIFKSGLGGKIGSQGNQYMSWIALEDLLAIVMYIIADEDIDGAVNAVSPNPVTNSDFTETLGKILSRPTFVPAPKFLLRSILGRDLTEALLFSSTRVVPTRLINSEYRFHFPYLELALRNTLGKVLGETHYSS